MSLELLTDPKAVHAAMDECDQLTRDVFLQKYGFARARHYFVERNGVLYDSKAIAGVAIGKQHPDRKPLTSAEFSGGDQTVSPKLRQLGFQMFNNEESTQGGESTGFGSRHFANAMESFLKHYAEIRTGPFGIDEVLQETMDRLRMLVSSLPSFEARRDLDAEWSLGDGVWTSVPWIAVLDRRVAPDVDQGIYIGFLISRDLTHVHLTLMQGSTAIVSEQGQDAAASVLRARSEHYRTLVADLVDTGYRLDGDVDLDAEGWPALGYRAATIAHIPLDVTALPNDEELNALMTPLFTA